MCRFYAWLEAALGREAISRADHRRAPDGRSAPARRLRQPELSDHRRLQRQRRDAALPRHAQSFAEISTPDGLVAEGLLLIDSGAQVPGRHHRHHPRLADRHALRRAEAGFTRCSRARWRCRGRVFPPARSRRTWMRWRARRCGRAGLDFGHGTGHGVGYFLNVHEGPQSISRAMPDASMAMQPGMITSIGPGLYRRPLGHPHREPGAERQRRRGPTSSASTSPSRRSRSARSTAAASSCRCCARTSGSG